MGKWLARLILLLLVAAGAWYGWQSLRSQEGLEVRTSRLVTGPLVLTVTATARLAATTEVLVGCEVSGTVEEVLVAHNDRVARGQVIARLKPEFYRAEHEQAKADLARAVALRQARQVEEKEAKRQLDRTERLRQKEAASQEEHDARLAVYEAAKAVTASAQAAIEAAQNRVALTKYQLERTVIESPIDGIVLDRRVDVGQTVAARLLSPELFVLAEDLAKMELLADVSEADVGYVRPGQLATFTVNAYRDRTFEGKVRQVRNQPRTVGNVVTYTVVIDVANRDRLLRPGMPADVHIEIVRQETATKVANAALRFRPPLGPDEVRRLLDRVTWPQAPKPIDVLPGRTATTQPGEATFTPPPLEPTQAALWQHRDGAWVPVPIWTAFTDNRETAVVTGPGITGDSAFVVEIRKADASSNPLQRAIMMARPEGRRF